MNQINPTPDPVTERVVVGSIKIVEAPFRVKVPVFEDEVVKRPIFEDHVVKIPIGFDEVVNQLALDISKTAIALIEASTAKQIKMLESKIAELRNIKTEEQVIVKTKDVEVERPIYKDVSIERPVFKDKEVLNPVLKDVEVTNAIVIDKAVTNAVIKDLALTNAIIKDVEVERAIIREKVIDVIHPRYLDLKGNPV